MLDDWFDRFKCTASSNSRPARRRHDPVAGETLFTAETKEAARLGKENAKHLQDPLPLEQMHTVIEPNPNAAHKLKEHMSRRGESSLESFHLMLAHFGNCGMRTSLADNLNLTGAARHNLTTRHKLRLSKLTPENTQRRKIPAACESIVSHFNHSELAHMNTVAMSAGMSPHDVPLQNVEMLRADNEERCFSECLKWMNETKPRCAAQNRCLCKVCDIAAVSMTPPPPQQQQQQPVEVTRQIPQNVLPQNVPPPPEERNGDTTAEKSNNPTCMVHQPHPSVHPREQVMRGQAQQQQQQQQQHQFIQPHMHQNAPKPEPCCNNGTLPTNATGICTLSTMDSMPSHNVCTSDSYVLLQQMPPLAQHTGKKRQAST